MVSTMGLLKESDISSGEYSYTSVVVYMVDVLKLRTIVFLKEKT